MRRYTDRCTGLEMVDYGMGFVPAAGTGQIFSPVIATTFNALAPQPPAPPCPPGQSYVNGQCRSVLKPTTRRLSPTDCAWWRAPAQADVASAIQGAVSFHGKETTARAIDSVLQGGELTVEYFPNRDRVVAFLQGLRGQGLPSNFGSIVVDCVQGSAPVRKLCQTGYVWSGTACVPAPPSTFVPGVFTGGGDNATFLPYREPPAPPCPPGYVWSGTACVPAPPSRCPNGYYWNGNSCVVIPTDP